MQDWAIAGLGQCRAGPMQGWANAGLGQRGARSMREMDALGRHRGWPPRSARVTMASRTVGGIGRLTW